MKATPVNNPRPRRADLPLDWSFSAAPAGPDPASAPTAPGRPPARRRWPARWLAALAGLAVLAALGAWLFTQVGLHRLQAQLAAQVAYEDQRAQAGDVSAVLAVQAANQPEWNHQLAAYTRLGLAAPLPAGDLQSAGTPPRLTQLDPLDGDLFAATVTRDYLDPAGQTVAFDLVQRYRNPGPGTWERLAPDTSALTPTSLFIGHWLSITLPAVDRPWLDPALRQADDLIGQTCAEWADTCPPGHRLLAAFGAAQNPPTRFATDGATAPAASQPRLFWLDPAPYATLAAPLLAGRPHNAAAQAALARSLSAQLLGLYAGDLAGPARQSDDYFLDALVARGEVRHLGADAAPAQVAPQDYPDLSTLWQLAGANLPQTGWRTDLAARRAAFDFLNVALAGQPPTADGRLLRRLRQGGGASLDDWLAGVLGPAARSAPAAWQQRTLDSFARHPVTDWQPYSGLTLVCTDGVYQARGGAPKFRGGLSVDPSSTLTVGDRSPDGRYLAVLGWATDLSNQQFSLAVMDLNTGTLAAVSAAPVVTVLGWAADNQLLYTLNSTPLSPIAAADELALLRYDPARQSSRLLIPERISPYAFGRALWSADRSALLIALVTPAAAPATADWALLTLTPTVQVRRLPMPGDVVALAPDGRQVAYVRLDPSVSPVHLDVLDVATGAVRRLAITTDPALPPGLERFLFPRWSADGQQLLWLAYTHNGASSYLLTAPAAGGPLRVWGNSSRAPWFGASFAPDGRYLLTSSQTDPRAPAQFWLFDPRAPAVQPPRVGAATSSVWAPVGHRLVLAGPAGVSSLDPATGAWEYLGPWPNCQLRW